MHEIHLGVSLDEALDKMVARLNCPDFELVAISIITARQTGGELTSILERLASVIRERVRITGRIKALTAQGRMQAVIHRAHALGAFHCHDVYCDGHDDEFLFQPARHSLHYRRDCA